MKEGKWDGNSGSTGRNKEWMMEMRRKRKGKKRGKGKFNKRFRKDRAEN